MFSLQTQKNQTPNSEAFPNLYITGFSTDGVCIDVVFLLWVYLHCGSNQNRQ